MSARTGLTGGPASTEIDLFTIDQGDGRLRDISEAFATLLGMPAGEVNGRCLSEFVYQDDRDELSEQLAGLAGSQDTTIECRFVQSNGQAIYVQWVARRLAGQDRWRAAGTDTADLVKLLADRRDLRTRLDLAVGQATVAMWELDIALAQFIWEPQAAEVLGVGQNALPTTADALSDVVIPADREALRSAMQRLVQEGTTDVGLRVGVDPSMRYLSLRGRVLDPHRTGTPARAVGLLLDVTTEKAMEEQLLRMSVSDGLTGTPNRRAFDQALRGESRRCTRAGEPLSIVMIDVDHFKQFNDTHGHIIGDQALVAVARALTAQLHREGDVLARYGGEEFAAVLPGARPGDALEVGHRLAQAVREVKIRQAPEWTPSVSVGTASWLPEDDKLKPAGLLGQADQALYAAKRAGRDQVVAYAPLSTTPVLG
jgi:diguanylate cyclase (GGDEF)-like protein/PAS domain S-box-containing protein